MTKDEKAAEIAALRTKISFCRVQGVIGMRSVSNRELHELADVLERYLGVLEGQGQEKAPADYAPKPPRRGRR